MARKWNMASYSDIHELQNKIMKDTTEGLTALIVQNMQYIGERCVAIARDKNRANTWGDVTGNLRSSIGYIVQVNGKAVIQSNIEVYEGRDGQNAQKGAPAARALLKSLSGTKQSGVVLFVVAGMNYASYVEEIRHRDVLATSWLEGERLANKLLGQLFSKTK